MPFYIFPAGSIQPSDFFIALMMIIYLIQNDLKFKGRIKEVLKRFLHFCLYLTLVNLIVTVARIGLYSKGLPWFVISAFYYYNLGVMAFAIMLYQRYGKAFLETTFFSLILVAVLQLVLSSVLGLGGGLRDSLFFTNPNQLGYYGLSALAAVLILDSELKQNPIWIYLAFVVFSYMLLQSVSKAALGSALILLVIYLYDSIKLNLRALVSIAGLLIIGLVVFNFSSFGQEFLENWQYREANSQVEKGVGITEWEYRGYDRIVNHPYYLFFGAGEGAYNRFDTYIEDHEMHSSIGTIIFCYGLPGTFLFIRFVLSLFQNLPLKRIIYSLPLFAYGVTHMGLRFTVFWLALMMLPVSQMEKVAKRKNKIRKIWTYLQLQKKSASA
jgi:hypothetical protein